VLSAVLGAAVEWQALDHNVAIGISLPPKVEKHLKTIPSAEQLRTLTEALDAGLLVRLLAVTGLRVSEAIALKWSDVDWQRQTVTVRRRWYRGNMDTPKSLASVRHEELQLFQVRRSQRCACQLFSHFSERPEPTRLGLVDTRPRVVGGDLTSRKRLGGVRSRPSISDVLAGLLNPKDGHSGTETVGFGWWNGFHMSACADNRNRSHQSCLRTCGCTT